MRLRRQRSSSSARVWDRRRLTTAGRAQRQPLALSFLPSPLRPMRRSPHARFAFSDPRMVVEADQHRPDRRYNMASARACEFAVCEHAAGPAPAERGLGHRILEQQPLLDGPEAAASPAAAATGVTAPAAATMIATVAMAIRHLDIPSPSPLRGRWAAPRKPGERCSSVLGTAAFTPAFQRSLCGRGGPSRPVRRRRGARSRGCC